MFSPTLSFILKSLERTYSLPLRNHVILSMSCLNKEVRSQLIYNVPHTVSLKKFGKSYIVSHNIFFSCICLMGKDRSDVLCSTPLSVLYKGLGGASAYLYVLVIYVSGLQKKSETNPFPL